jgi:hypothetical protein
MRSYFRVGNRDLNCKYISLHQLVCTMLPKDFAVLASDSSTCRAAIFFHLDDCQCNLTNGCEVLRVIHDYNNQHYAIKFFPILTGTWTGAVMPKLLSDLTDLHWAEPVAVGQLTSQACLAIVLDFAEIVFGASVPPAVAQAAELSLLVEDMDGWARAATCLGFALGHVLRSAAANVTDVAWPNVEQQYMERLYFPYSGQHDALLEGEHYLKKLIHIACSPHPVGEGLRGARAVLRNSSLALRCRRRRN